MSQKQDVTVVDSKRRWNKRTVVIVLVVVVVLAAACAGVGWWLGHRSDSSTDDKGKIPQLTGNALNDAVNKKFAQGDYAGATELLKAQDSAATDSTTKLLLASSYVNDKKYDDALKVYAELDAAGSLSGADTATAASVAELAKDYQAAIKYYQEASTRVKAEKAPTADDQVLMYQAKVKELQKKL